MLSTQVSGLLRRRRERGKRVRVVRDSYADPGMASVAAAALLLVPTAVMLCSEGGRVRQDRAV